MAGRFVRASKYQYKSRPGAENTELTAAGQANPEYLSVNWEASGGGAFAVIPVNEKGRLPEQIPLFRGHTGPVLDTDWWVDTAEDAPSIADTSGSDDGKVFIWQVPQGFSLYSDAEEPADVAPVSKLTGHSRKVGQVLFNPAAENILASASGDYTIKLWDIGAGKSNLTLKHGDIVQSLSWSANGSMLATTSRDKKLRIWDVRQERPAHEVAGHSGAKNSRVVWMGEHNRLATTGFSKMSDRQMALWDVGAPAEPIGGFTVLDSISGVCMPFWVRDGNIRYFEYENDKFEFLSEYKSGDPQRGIAFVPRRGINVHENEVMRAYKTVNDAYIEPISFTVPRRAEVFQSDIYPPATGTKPAVSAAEWLSGKDGIPSKIDLESVYDGNAPIEVAADYKPPTAAPAPAPVKAAAAPKKENDTPRSPVATRSPPPTMSEQKGSISAMASKFQDDEVEDDEDETSSFEEIAKPVQKSIPIAAKAEPRSPTKPSPTKTEPPKPAPVSQATPRSVQPPASSAPTTIPTSSGPISAVSSNEAVETSLQQIKSLLETQTRTITAQSEKIGHLAQEVDTLKMRVGTGAEDQSERIRQLELELEAARS
ncbi:Coronin-like protein crn1 [Lachnellula cervina]|uniref:Coronin n=1 Tax=Lachnellula cervina TaxID=1316786 RepID=A0A7D8YJU4_9HELO|nr:Coronin-like protein crn1 [Lachnellula cervina]